MALVKEHFFINNCFGSFYRGVLNYFADEFYTFKYRVIGTYDKSVEFFNKKIQNESEIDKKLLPAITLDPSGEFNPEERGGRFQWQYPNLSPGFGSKLFEPIYQDDEVIITPVFTRFQGTFELLFWLNSVYEYLDVRTALIMWSGGMNRWLRPRFFWSYILLPDDILLYDYKNEYKPSLEHRVDWNNSKAVITLIRNINQERIVYPVKLTPIFRIDSLSDASEKYGGDQLASHKLTASITYEIEMPTFLHLKTDYKLESINLSAELGNVYSKYGTDPPVETLGKLYDHFGSEEPYKDIPDMEIHRIPPCDLVDATSFTLVEGDNVITYPNSEDIITWNPIAIGRLKVINNQSDWDDVLQGDIIYSETFAVANLPQMRIANGFVTKHYNQQSFIRRKVDLLRKTLFAGIPSTTHPGGLSVTQINSLVAHDGEIITVDPYTMKIYLGELNTEFISPNEVGWGRNAIAGIEKSDLEKLGEVKEMNDLRSSAIDATFDKYDDKELQWKGDREFSKRVVYEFTDQDIAIDCTGDVIIDITGIYYVIDPLEIELVSYPGKLRYKTDYEIDFVNQIVKLFIKPRVGEIVELFFFDKSYEALREIRDFTLDEPDINKKGFKWINTTSGTSSITGHTVVANYIYEWNAEFQGWNFTEPVENQTVYIITDTKPPLIPPAPQWSVYEGDKAYYFNGTNWIPK